MYQSLLYHYTKKGEFMQLSRQVFHARHLPFDWRQETRRERVPSAPLVFLWKNKKPEGVKFDSTT
jgi:hypothetical protein